MLLRTTWLRRSQLHRDQPSPSTWKHLHLLTGARIVGSGRTRQRVTSTHLVRKSLDRPASVVVLHDLHHRGHDASVHGAPRAGRPVQQPPQQQTLSAQDIESAISRRHVPADEAEIDASMQMLRPDVTVLDQLPFERLRQQLVDAYTLPQLSRHLSTVLRPPGPRPRPHAPTLADPKYDVKAVQESPWQPGRTALDTRRPKLVNSTTWSRKSRTADRILRLAWNIAVRSEEREMGELELALQPWQMSMLFDLTCEGHMYYKRLLSPPLLVEATEVLPWRPDRVVRIVGRRRDAEDVAYQLQVALRDVCRVDVDLASFAMETTKATRVTDICSNAELDHISRLTQSAIVAEQGSTVAIYNRSVEGINHARRLLLSLLTPTPRSLPIDATCSNHDGGRVPAPCLLPADATSLGLHIREQGLESTRQITRTTAPAATAATRLSSSQRRNEAASTIADHLESLDTTRQDLHDDTSRSEGYWKGPSAPSEWQAEVVRLLHPVHPSAQPTQRTGEYSALSPMHTAVQRHSPGIESVLSRFDMHTDAAEDLDGRPMTAQSAADRWSPRLIAHLTPAPPLRQRHHAPRIEMHFSLAASRDHELRLIDMRAIFNEQATEVPLPSSSVDLLFTKHQAMVAVIELVRTEHHIAAFVQALRESVRAIGSTISAPPEVVIHLPASLIGTQPNVDEWPTTYLLERFEQIQSRLFAINSDSPCGRMSNSASAASHRANDIRVEYKEVEGDGIHGSSSILVVKHAGPVPNKLTRSEDAMASPRCRAQPSVTSTAEGQVDGARPAPARPTYQTALAALHVAKLLTDAADGSLGVLTTVPSENR